MLNHRFTQEEYEAEQARLHAQVGAKVEALLPNNSPLIAVLRHELLAPAQFPIGCEVRELLDEIDELRAPYIEAQREFEEATRLRDAAQRAVDSIDPVSASAVQYQAAAARLSGLQSKTRTLGERARTARHQFDCAESTLNTLMAEYRQITIELNGIPSLDGPLEERETIYDRGRLHGRVSELSFLLKVLFQVELSESEMHEASTARAA